MTRFRPIDKYRLKQNPAYENKIILKKENNMKELKDYKIDNKKLIKVQFEYEDGIIQNIEGEDAKEWMKNIDGMCMIGHIHGSHMKQFNWKFYKKE